MEEQNSNNEAQMPVRKKSNMPKIFVVLLIGGTIILWFVAMRSSGPGIPDSPRLQKPAPGFTLQDLKSGEEYSLKDFKGQPVVLNFWASWCVSCREEAKILERIYKDLEPSRVKVLGVAIQDTSEDALRFNRRYGQSFQSLLDVPGRVAVDYGVLGVPETFLINPDGIVHERIIGVVSEARVYQALREMNWPIKGSGKDTGTQPGADQ